MGTALTIVADAAVNVEGPINDEGVDRAGKPLVVIVVGADVVVGAATLAAALALGFHQH